jgi:choice-of-anchor A domain-containing protein
MTATTSVAGNAVNLSGGQTLTVTGTAGTNVLDVASIQMSGGSTKLIFSAPQGAQFIVNDSGVLNLSGGSMILLQGGLVPSSIVFNVTGQQVQISGGSIVSGIILATRSSVSLQGILTGELIGGQGTLVNISGSTKIAPGQ